MATISGRVVFDRDRSATFSSGDSGISNIPIVLQNIDTNERLTVLTDPSGNYRFINVPNANYRIIESFGTTGGVPTPGDFSEAVRGSVPQGINPPINAVTNPPTGSTNLDSVTPSTLLVTVSGANLTNQNFFNGPVIYTPIQTILDPCAAISGENLIDAADNGTFGSFSQGTPANTGAPVEPYPGVTPDFSYVLPNTGSYTPSGGEYTVQNIMNDNSSIQTGSWWRIADHTVGNETGRMMIVNGDNPGAVFFRDVVAVKPNTNYLFTSWILNLFRITGRPDPQLGVRISGENGNVLYDASLGALIPVNENAPEWKEIGSVINSQNNTLIAVEFLSQGPEVVGNDYAIDDILLNEIQVPEFTPVKTVDRQTANVGETVKYTVSLTNTCSSPITDLFFQDIIPSGLSFVTGSTTVNGQSISASDPNIGFKLPNDVPGGQTVTIEFLARVDTIPNSNPALNRASIRYSYTPVEGGIPVEFDVTSNEVPVRVNESADISVVKTARPTPVREGEMLTYTLTVSNTGPSDAKDVVVFDDTTEGISNAEFSIDGGATWQSWTGSYNIGTLENQKSVTILIRGTVLPSPSGVVINTASVKSSTSDPNADNNNPTVNTPIQAAEGTDVSIKKTACPGVVKPCDCLVYTLTVKNNGPQTAQQVKISDSIPSELNNPIYSTDSGQTWQTWTGSYTVGSIAANASVSIKILAIVSSCARCDIYNTARVSSSTADTNLSNNVASAVVFVSQS